MYFESAIDWGPADFVERPESKQLAKVLVLKILEAQVLKASPMKPWWHRFHCKAYKRFDPASHWIHMSTIILGPEAPPGQAALYNHQ